MWCYLYFHIFSINTKGNDYDLKQSPCLREIDSFHTPDGQVFICGIEHSTDQTPQTPNTAKKWQLPNAKIRCFSAAIRFDKNYVQVEETKGMSEY